MSSYLVRDTKLPTQFVSPGVFGKSSGLFPAFAELANTEAPIAAREVLPKSRRRMVHRELGRFMVGCHTRELRLPYPHDAGQPDSSD